MKKIINLVKVLFKLNINSSDDKKNIKKYWLIIGFGAYLLFIYISMWKQFINPLQEIGQGEIAINLILNISSMLILMTSITYLINILYFANDMENIIPFPFKPREIFTAKLIIAYLYELMIATMLSLPGFISYGFELNKGAMYYVLAIIVYLLLPVVPVALLAIFYIILARFLKINKYKNFFKIFSTVAILLVVIAFQIGLNNNMLENGNYDGNYILQMCNNLKNTMPYHMQVASHIFDNIGSFSSYTSLLEFILISVSMAFITVYGFEKLYMKTVYHNSDVSFNFKENSKLVYKVKKQYCSFVSVELKKLFRNVTFFIQCVLPTTIMPAVILVGMFSTKTAGNEFDVNSNSIIKMLFAFLVIQFFMMMNQISSTAISRDGGEEAGYVKSLPINKFKIIHAKAMPSVYVGLFNLCFAIVFDCIIFDLYWFEIVELIIGGILLNYIQSYLFLIIDMKKPKLRWESEIAVIKHNMNVLKSIMLWFVNIIITSLIGNVFLMLGTKYFSIAYILLLVLSYTLIQEFLKNNVEKLYERIY